MIAARSPATMLARGNAARPALVPTRLAGRRATGAKLAAIMPVAETASLASALEAALGPTAESFKALDLPAPLIKYGHPGNMGVVFLAMLLYGGVGLGWQIRNESGDAASLEKAKDLHPKLSAGAFFFFALGASGGILSLLMQGKPILESPHFTTGMLGLGLLSVQAMLPLFFSEGQSVRTAHAYLGTSIAALLAVHGALGVKLALSL